MNFYLCDFMTEEKFSLLRLPILPCVGFLTTFKKLYTNGFRKVCSDPIIFSVARTRPKRTFFVNLGKLKFSFSLFHFPCAPLWKNKYKQRNKNSSYFSWNKARGGRKYRRVYYNFYFLVTAFNWSKTSETQIIIDTPQKQLHLLFAAPCR